MTIRVAKLRIEMIDEPVCRLWIATGTRQAPGGNDYVMMRRFGRFDNSTDRRPVQFFLAAMIAVMFTVGCASTPEPMEDTGDAVDSEFSDSSNTAPVPDSGMSDRNVSNTSLNIAPVYFALDSVTIRSEYDSILGMTATALTESGATVVIEGHCDERGSDDYNVALGERRAGAVRNYLYNLGVPMSQMSIVSYGEAQPAVSGSGETAWQLNRRAQFQVR
jgi:peptidoglycan-associated lipoprotein